MEAFAQFASELDDVTRKQLEHGQRAVEILKQDRFNPLTIAQMAISLFLIEKEFLLDVALNRIAEFERQLHLHFQEQHQDVLSKINQDPSYTEEIAQELKNIIGGFKTEFMKFT